MLAEPRLVQHTMTVHFPRRPGIRREVNVLEDALNEACPDGYGTPQVIPMPDEFGADFPRIIFSSVKGFSTIAVSQQTISLVVNYSIDWQIDTKKCLEYLKKRAGMLFKMLERLEESSAYVGVTTLARVSSTENDANEVLEPLKRLLSPDLDLDGANEITFRLSKSVDNIYFTNATIATSMEWTPDHIASGRFPLGEHTSANIDIVGDFNNRLAFNENSIDVTTLADAVGMIDQGATYVFSLVEMVRGTTHG